MPRSEPTYYPNRSDGDHLQLVPQTRSKCPALHACMLPARPCTCTQIACRLGRTATHTAGLTLVACVSKRVKASSLSLTVVSCLITRLVCFYPCSHPRIQIPLSMGFKNCDYVLFIFGVSTSCKFQVPFTLPGFQNTTCQVNNIVL